MASIINALTTGGGGLSVAGDTSGILQFQSNNTATVTVDTSGNVGIGTSSPSSRLHTYTSSGGNKIIVEAGAASQQAVVQLTTNASTPGQCQLYMGKSGATTNGQVGYDPNSDFMYFYTSNTERMRIDSSGNLYLGITTTSGASAGMLFEKVGVINVSRGTTSSVNVAEWRNPNGVVGTIATSGSSTTYNTSSDYRLKENIYPMTGALAKVAQLKPVTYKWKVDGADGEGFIAHELAEVVPDCVTGEKDAVDAEGNPVYQGIDTSFLVATLTAALQELKAINDQQAQTITALTARIVALEGK